MPSSLESDLASSEDGVSTLKSLELSIVPVVNQVSTAVAEVAAAFSAEDGVSTLKSLELSIVPVANQVSTTVAEGADDFLGGRCLYPQVLGVVYCSCGESSFHCGGRREGPVGPAGFESMFIGWKTCHLPSPPC